MKKKGSIYELDGRVELKKSSTSRYTACSCNVFRKYFATYNSVWFIKYRF